MRLRVRLENSTIGQQTNRKNLLLLHNLRWAAIVGQVATVGTVYYGLEIPLPLGRMASVILMLVALNLLTFYRVRSGKIIREEELLLQLLCDVGALSVQFYLSGGASNPFIGLFLLQVIIAATILRGFYTWVLVAVTLSCYVLLSFYKIEIPHLHHYHIGEFFNLHIHGMLLSYAIGAVSVAYFVVQMSKNLRARDQALAKLKERQFAEENILRLGMLAASAAHELGTPLSTIGLLAEHYKEDAANKNQQERSARLSGQVMRCKEIITRITSLAGAARAESGTPCRLDVFLNEMAERWRKAHPGANLHLNAAGPVPAPLIIAEFALEQAVCNLLDNAADASPGEITMQAAWSSHLLSISIRDRGNGISPEIIAALGQPGTTTKITGLGMGLFLTQAVVNRLEGTLMLENAAGGGVAATIEIPLGNIAA